MADERQVKAKQKPASGSKSVHKKTAKNRKQLEASIRTQVAAEEKAHHIVEHLVLEQCVDESYLLEAGSYIMPSHYSDVTEERAIAKVCGYPLCSNALTQVPKQKYKISVKTNRVFDITERKHYCSNFCYKASKYFESQIPTSPVWTRIGESPKKFTLLKATDSSFKPIPGEILVGSDKYESDHDLRNESELPSESASSICVKKNDQESYEETIEKVTPIDNNIEDIKGSKRGLKIEQGDIGDDVTKNLNQLTISPSTELVKDNHISEGMNSEDLAETELNTRLSSQWERNKEMPDKINEGSLKKTQETRENITLKEETGQNKKDIFLNSIKGTLMQWFTESTYTYLRITSCRKHDVQNDGDCKDKPECNEMNFFKDRSLRFLTKKPDDDDDDNDDDNKHDTQHKLQISPENLKITEKHTNIDESFPCVVPPIDSKAQLTIRRQIVLQKLIQVLPEILSKTTYNSNEVKAHFIALVKSFRLDSQNTMFKPLQWKVLATALVYLLEQHLYLKKVGYPSDIDYRKKMLMHLGLTLEDMDNILDGLPTKHQETATTSSPPQDISQVQSGTYSLMEDLD